MALELVECRSSVFSFQYLKSLGRQARAQKTANGGFVIDHKNVLQCGAGIHATFSRSTVSPAGTGKLMVKMAPLRSVRLPATIEPPIASTNPRQIASPRPVPAVFRSAA